MRPFVHAVTVRACSVRLTVVGSGTSQPQPETPASGLLIETDSTAVLVDCGQGIIRELMAYRDPRDLDAIVIGHMHADHYIDLISLRYLLPWEGVASAHIPILLPPGGKARLDALAGAISERPEFFNDAFSLIEYDPTHRIHVGDLTIGFVAGQHYVPAWGCLVTGPDGARIAISGDTGPSDGFVAAARGADVVVAEATLANSAFDDPRRGHLTAEEAIEMADRAGVPRVVLVHFRAELQDRIERACAARPGALAGRPGLRIEVDSADPRLAAARLTEQGPIHGIGEAVDPQGPDGPLAGGGPPIHRIVSASNGAEPDRPAQHIAGVTTN
ncbi:MAG TPA: MBL fold metallo-hydrolase [Patescibacteria group bacterium]|nr:MBL fold metallo-hydrolase [Patescibacteria group bacterium]